MSLRRLCPAVSTCLRAMNCYRGLLCFALLICCYTANISAQSSNATINGQITDSTGRVVPGTEVEAVNIDTNVASPSKSNGSGIYIVSGLIPGRYRLMVRKDGFKVINKTDITLHVQDILEQNFALEVGSVSESVTVKGDDQQINTTDASVSTVVDRQFAENLPMNGRSFQTLVELTPGVVAVASNSSDNGQFSINGQRGESNYWMLDGVSANIGIGTTVGNGMSGAAASFSALGGTNSLVSVDALQEFRIQTSTYAPEFGRTPGGQISIVTRSGTNTFHGTVFDYLRNSDLDASNWFNGYTNDPPLPKAQDRQNDFGGTFSGPIFKDKTFFFFSYEGLRLRLPQTTLSTVPCDSTCVVFGNSRQAAVPAMQQYLNAFPSPNGPEVFTSCTPNINGCPTSGGQSTGSAEFNASYSNPSSLNAYSLRIDHKLTDKLSLFGRYDYSPSSDAQRGGGTSLNTINTTTITTQTGTIGATWIPSSGIADDVRFNYSQVNATGKYYMDNYGGAKTLSPPFPNDLSTENAQFLFSITSLTNGSLYDGENAANVQRQINIVDDLSLQKRTHSFKIGVDFRRLSPTYSPNSYEQGVNFGSVTSAQAGNSTNAFVESHAGADVLFRNLGLYAQDTWRMRPNLTLTYGLRWDIDFVPKSTGGPAIPAVTDFDPTNIANASLAPAGTPPYHTRYDSVAPRVGIAYQVRQKQAWETVIRGGFGVFYDLASSQLGNLLYDGYPYDHLNELRSAAFPLSSAFAAPPAIAPPSPTSPTQVDFFDPNLAVPYTLEWNVAVEQALGKQQSISASYVGSSGKRLLETGYAIGDNPSILYAEYVVNGGSSNYNALQLQYNRRLSGGLQVLASYTWAHSIDTGSAGSAALYSNYYLPNMSNGNRGSSDFDIRNAFSGGITYEVPAPRRKNVIGAIAQGWSTDNFIVARSAPPVDVFDTNFFLFATGAGGDTRPDIVPGEPFYLYGSLYPGGKALNPAAFTSPPTDPTTGVPTRQGDLGRNALRGFGVAQWDSAIHRELLIRESLKLQFRAEMFNTLNHPIFGQPYPLLGYGGFGIANETLNEYLNGGSYSGSNVGGGALSPLYQLGGPRSIQLALKLFF